MSFWNHGELHFDDVPGLRNKKLRLMQFVVGPIQTNCYAVISGIEALVVDPGAEGARIAEALKDVRVTCVVATHGHADHVAGVQALLDATGAQFEMAQPDIELARHARRNHALGITYDADAPQPNVVLTPGNQLAVGDAHFQVLASPGHTPGGIVLLGLDEAAGLAFVGDTIFAGSAGRTDLDGGDSATLMQTLTSLKQEIPPQTHLLCGHGDATTMGWELAHNPYLIQR